MMTSWEIGCEISIMRHFEDNMMMAVIIKMRKVVRKVVGREGCDGAGT